MGFGFWIGSPWLLAIVGGLSLSGILQLVRKRRNLAFSGVLALLVVGIDSVSYALVPSVTFTVAALAFPGHIVVEFRPDCPESTRRTVPLHIEYVVPESGYTCSSSQLPEYLDVNFVLYGRDPAVRRATPPLAGGTFFRRGHAKLCRPVAKLRTQGAGGEGHGRGSCIVA